MKSNKTTIIGLIAAILGLATQFFPQYAAILTPAAAVATGLIGVVAKDSGVTGGTIAANGEAQKRIDADANAQPLAK